MRFFAQIACAFAATTFCCWPATSFGDQTSLTPSCATRLAAFANTDAETRAPKLVDFLQGRAYERLARTQPQDFKELSEAIASQQAGKPGRFGFESKSIMGGFEVSKANGRLEVKILYIKLYDGKGKAKGKQAKISYGKTNTSLNMGFPRLLVALAEGIEKQLATDPTLKEIAIVGSNVVNQPLVNQLKEFGFEGGNANSYSVLMNSMRQEGLIASLMLSTMKVLGPGGAPLKAMQAITAGTKAIATIRHRDLGKKWELLLKVQNRELEAPANVPLNESPQ